MAIQRMLIMKIHALLACFFIPIATLYFISGALYSFDIKGHIDKQVYTVALDRPFAPDLAQVSNWASTALQQRGLAPPTGKSTITKKSDSYEYRWGDLHRLVVIHPTIDPLQAELIYRTRNPLAQIMRVHRAEAGFAVKIYSVAMAISLILILGTGVYLALKLPKLRRIALITLGLGFIAILPVFA